MQRGLVQRLVRYWGMLWRRFTPAVVESEQEETSPSTADRGRFWREFRQGQREADAHAARSRP